VTLTADFARTRIDCFSSVQCACCERGFTGERRADVTAAVEWRSPSRVHCRCRRRGGGGGGQVALCSRRQLGSSRVRDEAVPALLRRILNNDAASTSAVAARGFRGDTPGDLKRCRTALQAEAGGDPPFLRVAQQVGLAVGRSRTRVGANSAASTGGSLTSLAGDCLHCKLYYIGRQ